ncbi:MAG: glycosyltransferase family 4 protein [Gemmatimonadota bacterium]
MTGRGGERPRVLYWVQDFLPSIGGVQVLAGQLLPALRDRGFDFAVMASRDFTDLPERSEWDGIPVHRFPFREALTEGDPGLLLETLKRVEALKRSFRPHLVHVNLTDPSVFFHLRTTGDDPPPFLLTTRVAMTQASAGPDTVLGRAVRSADRVTTISRALRDGLVDLVPALADTCEVIYNGLKLPPLAPTPPPLEPPRLLCLGRLAPEKGFDLALDALDRLAPGHPDLHMTVAGEGPASGALRARASALGVAERVTFSGWVQPEGVPSLVARSTLVLVPSRWREGFGLVALQAHQMGRPVVASRVGGLAEVVEDGTTGLLVEKDDPAALAEAVRTLLADPVRLRAMGRRARERAVGAFGFERHVAAYERIYQEMTGIRRT